ncbi:MAG: hypothetical protein AAGC74_10035 [Verrucomicrobiota bacterium]
MRLLLLLLLATPLLALDSRHLTFTDTEILAHGDFNGDSNIDLVVVQRDTGQYRLGFNFGNGNFLWRNPAPSGISDVTGVATGRFLFINRDQLALTSPTSNRIILIDVFLTTPTIVQPSGLGPETLAAIEFPSLPSNDATYSDIFTTSSANSAPSNRQSHLLRGTSAGHVDAQTDNDLFLRKRPGRTKLLNSQSDRLAFISNEGGEDILRVFDPATFPTAPSLTSLPLGGNALEYTHASFITSLPDRNQYLTWEPGSDTLQVIPTLASGNFGTPTITSLPLGPIDSITPVQTTNATQFLIIANNGATAATYTLDASSNPVLQDQFLAPEGRRFSLPSGSSNNTFLLLTQPPAGGPSNQVEHFTHDGTSWNPSATDTLPTPLADSTLVNIFLFDSEPFVSPTAQLRETSFSPDWTSDFSINGSGLVTVGRRIDNGPTFGIGNPFSINLGTFPNITHGFTNQPRAEFSLTSRSATLGPLPPQITIDPPGGTYTRYLQPSITSTANAFYRISSTSAWTPTTGSLITLPGSTLEPVIVEYYAEDSSSGLKSPIFSATYQFDGYIDSDGDGAPDFVEIANGINDPTFGADTDEDGYDDLSELLAGTDANDPASTPTSRPANASSFNISVTPLSHNTASFGSSNRTSAFNTNLAAYATTGGILAQTDTGTTPAASFTGLPSSPRDGFLLIATDPNFDVLQNGLIVVPEGRELLGLIPIPDTTPEPVEYNPSGSTLNQQAAAWLSQYQTYLNNRPQPTLTESLTLEDTLALLLTERILALELADDDPSFDPDTFTLTPHRDPGLIPPTESQLRALQYQTTPNDSILLPDLFDHIQSSFSSPGPELTQLLALANDIYRLSCDLAFDNPGLYPNPVDTLREFLRNGPKIGEPDAIPLLPGSTTDTSYSENVNFSGAELILANSALRELHTNLPRRNAFTFTVQITSQTYTQPIPIVGREAGTNLIPEALFDRNGNPFRLPAEYELPLGTRLTVTLYDDRTNDLPFVPGSSTSWEVHSAAIHSYPDPPNTDSDGNLLDDAWEAYYLTSSGNGFTDSDNDGYTDLQEQLEETNPLSNSSFPATAAFAATPPPVCIESVGTDQFLLTVTFPTIYAEDIAFTLQNNTNLLFFPPGTQEALPSPTDPNAYTLTIPKPAFNKSFYRFAMSLRE